MVSPQLTPSPPPPPLRVAALLGPTASGKTAAALALRAAGLAVEAVGCDALQLVRRLDAATAKPDADERRRLPHHLIDVADPIEKLSAGRYVAFADAACEYIIARGGWPLLVGGTGLYHRAFVRGLAQIPPVPAALRDDLSHEYASRGAEFMHGELAAVDPDYAALTPANNRQRVLRALEVFRATGRPLSHWHADHAAAAPRVQCFTVVLEPERAWLVERIDRRASAMVEPLLAEVRELLAAGLPLSSPGLQAIGYRDAAAVIAGTAPLAGFGDRLAAAHRLYARRQATWFRKTPAEVRLGRTDDAALEHLASALRAWFAPRAGSDVL